MIITTFLGHCPSLLVCPQSTIQRHPLKTRVVPCLSSSPCIPPSEFSLPLNSFRMETKATLFHEVPRDLPLPAQTSPAITLPLFPLPQPLSEAPGPLLSQGLCMCYPILPPTRRSIAHSLPLSPSSSPCSAISPSQGLLPDNCLPSSHPSHPLFLLYFAPSEDHLTHYGNHLFVCPLS